MSFNRTVVPFTFILRPSAVLAKSGVVNERQLPAAKICCSGSEASLIQAATGFGEISRNSNRSAVISLWEVSMRSVGSGYVFGALVAIGAILMLPICGHAQESTVSGTVTDPTGAVIPGVTVTATHTETGNKFEAVTDERGGYRLLVRVGNYRMTAGLPGFGTVNRNIEVLIGQTVVVNIELMPSTVAETVNVVGEVPLVDTETTKVGANIDPRQMQELPLNGRNWMDLTLLAPGARRNEAVGLVQNRQGYGVTNVDGQDVTINYHSAPDTEQSGFNKDAIGEFEVIANRFDASQGRSAGMVVNAVTKAGTNVYAGTFGGYFRSDEFNAADFVANRVLPYSNQQLSATFGGPIKKDKAHFFGSYGYAREPHTYTYNSPYPSFNVDVNFPSRAHTVLGRVDYQFTSATRLSVRGSGFNNLFYNLGTNSATTHPSAGGTRGRVATQYFANLTHVLSNRTVNQLKGGFTNYERQDQPAVRWKGQDFPYHPVLHGGSVIVMLRGYTIGASPLNILQDTQSIRDDLTTSLGRHDLKLGIRCDFDTNTNSAKVRFMPWLPGNLPREKTNFAPRFGLNLGLNDRTVLRGGYGLFYAFAPNDGVQQTEGYLHRFENQIFNDGGPDFTTVRDGFWGWFGGHKPSFQGSLQHACDVNFVAGCVYRSLTQEIYYPGRKTSYSH